MLLYAQIVICDHINKSGNLAFVLKIPLCHLYFKGQTCYACFFVYLWFLCFSHILNLDPNKSNCENNPKETRNHLLSTVQNNIKTWYKLILGNSKYFVVLPLEMSFTSNLMQLWNLGIKYGSQFFCTVDSIQEWRPIFMSNSLQIPSGQNWA